MAVFIGTSGGDTIIPGTVSGGVAATPSGSKPSGAADSLYGEGGDDTLDGGGGADTLWGGDGSDTLKGGTGADEMRGGLGDDTYNVDNSGDRVFEVADPDGAQDEVDSTVTFTLPTFVELLSLEGTHDIDGTGNNLDNSIFGNYGNNVLRGLGGNDFITGGGDDDDTLDGGTGVDFMEGGDGDDIYIIDNSSDTALEYGDQGTDTVKSSASIDLSWESSIEIILLTGSKAVNAVGSGDDNAITGNDAKNTLDGRYGNDTISGLGGDDTLLGGFGDDTLKGGDGKDFLRGLTGRDALIGGKDNDTFGYTDWDQSTQSSRDVVRAGDGATAFQGAGDSAGDRFDLKVIDADSTRGGNQDFVFDGTKGKGHLWMVDSGDVTLVRGNVDGDSAVEFEVAIEDGAVKASAYTHADFLGLV